MRWFLSLSLKTTQTTVYRLRHKTDERIKMVQGTSQDLAACFSWKQDGLGFFSLASRLGEAQRGWCTWHHHRSRVELKLKTDGSI
jgi:hypothetical protein